MKKVLIALNVVCLLVVCGVYRSLAQSTTGPVFKALTDVVDYGEVAFKGDGTRELKFKNTGNEPLIITNAKGSCGCTVPDWPKEPIMPGQTGVIKIKYDTSRSGSINKSVTITTNEVESKDGNGQPVYKNHTVAVKGNVKAAPSTDGVPVQGGSTVPVD